MAVDCGDKNLVRKILFEDIRVENIQEGRLFHINSVSIQSMISNPVGELKILLSAISFIME